MNAIAIAVALALLPPATSAPRIVDDAPAAAEPGAPVDAAPVDAAPVDAEPIDAALVDEAPPVDDVEPVDDAAPVASERGRSRTPSPRVSEPHPGVVGGYWDMDRTQGPEPDDGQEQIIAGSILVPLGILSVSSSAATIWLSAPGHCTERWASVGGSPTADQCKGVRTFGIIRVTYGSLMVVTGAVLLGLGTQRREKHRLWERKQAVAPWFDARGGGLAWGGRFGARRF